MKNALGGFAERIEFLKQPATTGYHEILVWQFSNLTIIPTMKPTPSRQGDTVCHKLYTSIAHTGCDTTSVPTP
jgi:hypothetical protein